MNNAKDPLLRDLVVVELGTTAAAAYCGKCLSDLGARVVKVEPRTGDPHRRHGPFAGGEPHLERSARYAWLNTGKESLSLDAGTSDGREIVEALVAKADVLIPGDNGESLEEAGIAIEDLLAANEGLVVLKLSPFGSTGPHAGWLSDDIVQYAMGCWMHMTGKPDRAPLASGGDLAGAIHGLAAASAALMAIFARGEDGKGQVVEVAQQEVLALMQPYTPLSYSYTGIERPRSGMPFPMTIVPTTDGYLGINVLTQAQWEALCAATGQLDLLENPEYADPLSRAAHAQELTQRFAGWAADKQKAEVFEEGQQWRVPFGYVPKVAETPTLKQHAERGFFQEVEHPEGATATMPGVPFRIDTPIPLRRAPLLGEHNGPVLTDELGYSADDLQRLRELGVC